jgi:hypothetical protein
MDGKVRSPIINPAIANNAENPQSAGIAKTAISQLKHVRANWAARIDAGISQCAIQSGAPNNTNDKPTSAG